MWTTLKRLSTNQLAPFTRKVEVRMLNVRQGSDGGGAFRGPQRGRLTYCTCHCLRGMLVAGFSLSSWAPLMTGPDSIFRRGISLGPLSFVVETLRFNG
jgi:hypothetical protein